MEDVRRPLPSDLFGSSDEEEDEEEENADTKQEDSSVKDTGRIAVERAPKRPLNAEIFGGSSDEEKAPPKQPAVSKKFSKKQRKQRLQKPGGGGGAASEDDDVADMEPISASEEMVVDTNFDLNSSKRSRVVTDSDDEVN